MSDIVARLRKRREAELIGGYERIEWEDKDAIEAADKIDDLRAEVARLTAENEKLRGALQEAFEVYAGSDGFIPETAAEGYQQQVIKQIINCINAGLAHYRTSAMSDAKTPDEQLLALKAFARWAIQNTAWARCDLDGGEVQDEALKLGIIEERTATGKNFAEWRYIEDVVMGHNYYRFADWMKKAPAKDKSDG